MVGLNVRSLANSYAMQCYCKVRTIYILCVLTIWLLILPTASAGCSWYWYGPNCEYRCQCAHEACNADGSCRTNDYCHRRWFTHDCQYKNMVEFTGHVNSVNWLITGSKRLLDNDRVDREITIVFIPSLHFTWMRVVHTSGVPARFRILYNYKPCPHELYFKVNDETTDISCNVGLRVSQITFLGAILPHLKQVLVSGGRNAALKQATSQSSDYWEDGMHMASWRAVSGLYSKTLLDGTCTHTDSGSSKPPTWTLYFKDITRIHTVSLYNRIYKPERLAGFILNTYSHTNSLLESHRGSSSPLSEYHVHLQQVEFPVKQLTIRATQYENILTLCQVEAFEYEPPCSTGKWGRHCSLICNCKARHPCHPVTGVCAQECAFGFFGLQCDQKCIGNCDEKGCGFYDGLCIECAPGYEGLSCDMVCSSTSFGKNCTQPCSSNCRWGFCDRFTGGCLSCKMGMFGSDCSQTCSDKCHKNKCYSHNGMCWSCPQGYYKERCDSPCIESCTDNTCNRETGKCNVYCPPTTFSDDCNKKCIKNCDRCNDLECLRCSENYYGHNCSIHCPSSCRDETCGTAGSTAEDEEVNHRIWLILGIISVFIVVVIGAFLINIKFIRVKPTNKQTSASKAQRS